MSFLPKRYCSFALGGNICVLATNRLNTIWLYNHYTEKWRNYKVPCGKMAPSPIRSACAVVVGSDLYMFGGLDLIPKHLTNDLFKLTKTTTGCFYWSKIEMHRDMRLPSPRSEHGGWEYSECLWIFGGKTETWTSQAEYLNDNGVFVRGHTNQLLCYDPHLHTWTNPPCFGDVPSPRTEFSTAIMKDKIWLHAGYSRSDPYRALDDFFELDMRSRTWTQIQTGQAKPERRFLSCLSAVSDRYLVLHGGVGDDILSDTWIMDLSSYTWKRLPIKVDLPRLNRIGCYPGINKSVVIFGDQTDNIASSDGYIPTSHVMLEPKRLQQLAAVMIYNQRDVISWKCLPCKLISQLGLNDEITENVIEPE